MIAILYGGLLLYCLCHPEFISGSFRYKIVLFIDSNINLLIVFFDRFDIELYKKGFELRLAKYT